MKTETIQALDTILIDPTFSSKQKAAARTVLNARAHGADDLLSLVRLAAELTGCRGREWGQFVRTVATITGKEV